MLDAGLCALPSCGTLRHSGILRPEKKYISSVAATKKKNFE